MSGIRFGWLGKSRRAALLQLIATELTEWSRDWWIHHAPDQVVVNPVDREQWCPATFYAATAPSGALAMHLGGKDMNAFGRHLAGVVESADTGWAQRIGEEALGALAERMFRRAGIPNASKLCESAATLDLQRSQFGALHVDVALGRLAWSLTMDRRLADSLVPARDIQSAALTMRANALDQACLRVGAVLDFGSVNLTDLSDLRVGEILVGERRLQDSLQVHIEGHGVVAAGYLKRCGTQRAVVLDGLSMHGNG